MAALNPGIRRRRGAGVLLGTLLALLFAPAPVLAQAARVEEFYVPQRAFRIPFQEPADRRVQRLTLYVSEDNGRTWLSAATANAGDRFFNLTAPRDGWFSFATQTQ